MPQFQHDQDDQFQQVHSVIVDGQLTFSTPRYAWRHVPESNGCWGDETKIERVKEWPEDWIQNIFNERLFENIFCNSTYHSS